MGGLIRPATAGGLPKLTPGGPISVPVARSTQRMAGSGLTVSVPTMGGVRLLVPKMTVLMAPPVGLAGLAGAPPMKAFSAALSPLNSSRSSGEPWYCQIAQFIAGGLAAQSATQLKSCPSDG